MYYIVGSICPHNVIKSCFDIMETTFSVHIRGNSILLKSVIANKKLNMPEVLYFVWLYMVMVRAG